MARLVTALAVLAALVQGSEAVLGLFNNPTVVCDSLGFQPTFVYNTESELHDIAIDIDIGGTGDDNADCLAQMARQEVNGLPTFTYGNFSTSYTTHIPYMENSTYAACGGSFEHWNDTEDANKEYIKYQVGVNAIVTRTFRDKIERKTQYPFQLTCLLERVRNGISTNNSFLVDTQLVNAANSTEASDDFVFAATIKFYQSASYVSELTDTVIAPKNDEKLYLQVKQDNNQDLFKFVVDKCYATDGSATIADDSDEKKDVFFKDQCHVDETVTFSTGGGAFNFEILSFSFPRPTTTVFFHCNLYVCLASNTDAACTQKLQSACSTRRRRRSIEGIDFEKTITSTQAVLFEGSQIVAPSCGEGFVYDRQLQICSQENILEIQNVRLSQDIFIADYANSSSKAFKQMAMAKEYQLWVLLKTTGQNRIIHGVKIVRARPGSVILDVAVKYADSVSAEQAFDTFRQVLYTPASQTRVQSILQISQEKHTLAYVPVGRSEKVDTEKLILIVVVVVLFVVVFIAGVTLFKVKQVRQSSNTRNASGFDNKGIDA